MRSSSWISRWIKIVFVRSTLAHSRRSTGEHPASSDGPGPAPTLIHGRRLGRSAEYLSNAFLSVPPAMLSSTSTPAIGAP